MRQGSLRYASENTAVFCLDPQILPCARILLAGDGFLRVSRRKGGDRQMAVYTIIRVYEVPADNQQQATDRMIEALALHVERDFHVKDVIREPGAKPGQGKPVVLKPPAGWLTLVARQLTGKTR
jgi:hypothetical protein